MNTYDIVKLKNDAVIVGQISSDSQDHGRFAKLNLEAELTLRLRDGREYRTKLRETVEVSDEEKWRFMRGNPYLLP
jgi:hypothetical protein